MTKMLTDVDSDFKNVYECIICDYSTSRKNNYSKHLGTDKHKMLTNVDSQATKYLEVKQKNSKNYYCIICNYNTCNKYNFDKHLLTVKHLQSKKRQKIAENIKEIPKVAKVAHKINETTNHESYENNLIKSYNCNCGRGYKHRQSLSVHRKKCTLTKSNYESSNVNDMNKLIEKNTETLYETTYKQLFLKALEQNNVIQNALVEQNKQLVNMIPNINPTSIVNTNSNNKIKIKNNYNIHLFLNENCKNAINMNDFIKNLQIGVNDLKLTGDKGLVEGISNILITNLNKIPIPDRPIWCSDKKRKKIFIKQEIWEEDENNNKTKEAITNISTFQTKNINKFIENNPNWIHNDKQKDDYIMIVKHSTDDIIDKKDKILEKIIENIHLTGEKIEKIENN